ncbi:hypothetical protein DPMN_135471 [Dreissena polymorpha]|uniref:NADH dehydrogenase [ubiquinone] 1 alpha subcomplex subunit 1 n=1 Tax=Dreissena polymorpha TaxID=45954 RepID=A0A9D4JFU0_DREPO|nr:hypothetical protein DPMN_135471 [Dreissena polymorpha]
MWYELLPFFGIMFGAAAATQVVHIPFVYVSTGGRIYRRFSNYVDDRKWWERDKQLTGNMYKVAGLENLPEEESK